MKMNARPLLAISDGPEDDNPLTVSPAHLVLEGALIQIPSSSQTGQVENYCRFYKMGGTKNIERKFFLHWQEEYLDSLKRRTKAAIEDQGLKKGDIVLLLNERKTRLHWPIARVEELIFSRDNKARSALLRPSSEDKPVSKKETKETGGDIHKRK